METPFVERDCVFTANGHSFESGGAIVTDDAIVAYPGDPTNGLQDYQAGARGPLKTWKGEVIGTWRTVSAWRVRSAFGTHMMQIEAIVNGVTYTGRGMGSGMMFRGRRKAL